MTLALAAREPPCVDRGELRRPEVTLDVGRGSATVRARSRN